MQLQEAIPKLHRESSSPQKAFPYADPLGYFGNASLVATSRSGLHPPATLSTLHPQRGFGHSHAPSTSTDSLKHSNQIRPLSAVSTLQQGEHRVKFKEVGVGLHKKG